MTLTELPTQYVLQAVYDRLRDGLADTEYTVWSLAAPPGAEEPYAVIVEVRESYERHKGGGLFAVQASIHLEHGARDAIAFYETRNLIAQLMTSPTPLPLGGGWVHSPALGGFAGGESAGAWDGQQVAFGGRLTFELVVQKHR